MMKDPRISDDFVIIEIDGPSHFGKHSVNAAGKN